MPIHGLIVELEIDGQTVEGEIKSLSGSDFTVRMTRPFLGPWRWSPHIPWFARAIRSFADAAGNMTEYGVEKAERLLRQIYESERKLRNPSYLSDEYGIELSQLVTTFEEMWQAALDARKPMTVKQYRSRVRQLREQLKSGQLDRREHWQRVKALIDEVGLLSDDMFRSMRAALREDLRAGLSNPELHGKELRPASQGNQNYSFALSDVWRDFRERCKREHGMSDFDLNAFAEEILGEDRFRLLGFGWGRNWPRRR